MRVPGLRLGVCAILASIGAPPAGAARAQVVSEATEPVIGLPCEGCEAVFVGLPTALSSSARIAPEDEPGEPMRIVGTVYDPAGRPASGIILYAYQTDANGVYREDDRYEGWAGRHGQLRAWAITDAEGRYRFDTIRPASYPDTSIPAHVHMHVIEPGCCTYYVDGIHFDDDPLLTPEQREQTDEGRGGSAIVNPVRDEDGTWVVRRDIRLGQGVPGYPPGADRRGGPP